MRRKTTGTGRMRYMKDLTRRFKNGFREGASAKGDLRMHFPTSVATVQLWSSPATPSVSQGCFTASLCPLDVICALPIGSHNHVLVTSCMAARTLTAVSLQAGLEGHGDHIFSPASCAASRCRRDRAAQARGVGGLYPGVV